MISSPAVDRDTFPSGDRIARDIHRANRVVAGDASAAFRSDFYCGAAFGVCCAPPPVVPRATRDGT